MPKLISDYDIRLGVLALDRAFTIRPELGPIESHKGLLRFNLECEQPGFVELMYRSAKGFARDNRGHVEPRTPGRGVARPTFALVFDAPGRHASFGDRYASLAMELFMQLRENFIDWQVEHELRRVVADTDPKQRGKRGKLKVVHTRTS